MADHINSSDNFCALPFGHTTITTNGNYAVCCIHKTPTDSQVNINHSKLTPWLKSDYLQQVRQSFRNQERHPGCNSCWINEDLGLASMRNRTAKEYKILGVDEYTKFPVNIEVQLGNLCNLTCLMCSEKYSSAILAENIKLKINRHNQDDFKWSETAFDNLQDIIATGPKVLTVIGGEPLYNKKFLSILEALPQESCRNTLLHIVTNATQWNERWQAALQKFKLVRMMFSIDGTEHLYEYMRYPGVWNETELNIDQIITGSNIKPLVNAVIQNLNIGSIGSIIQWAKKRNLYLQLDQLIEPSWLNIINLPRHLKLNAVKHLETVLEWDLTDHLRQQLTSCYTQLTNSLEHPDNLAAWMEFQTQVGARDLVRNNSYKQFLPD
jgi:molybdenum cofactor biosynthesis enzyme MoaA